MQVQAVLWLALPLFVAGGSALLAYFIMQARMEVAVAKEREALAEAQAIINAQKSTMEERVKAVQEATRRTTMDEIMKEFRVEERSYVRESRSLDSAKRTMVTQERMFFRNIPLSDWREHEMVVEDNLQGPTLSAGAGSVEFANALPPGRPEVSDRVYPIDQPLDQRGKAPARDKRSLAHAGFGAQ
jgi:hypothetical protein